MGLTVNLEYPAASGVPTGQTEFDPGDTIGLLIKGMGDLKSFSVLVVYDNPAASSFSYEGTASIMGNGNIQIPLPNVVTHALLTFKTGAFIGTDTVTISFGVGEVALPPASTPKPTNWYLIGGLAFVGAIGVGLLARNVINR
jgi:hypothetical protein